MMKSRIGVNVTASFLALILILPGITSALGHGQVWGRIGNPQGDIWYRADSGDEQHGLWTCVNTFNDIDEDEWTTAFTILDLEYRDASQIPPPANYYYYVKYMTIPWVAMTWNNAGRIIYPFGDSDGTMNNTIRFVQGNFDEENLDNNPVLPTSMNAIYNLGINQNANVDFCFEIWYQLNVNPANGQGDFDMHIRVLQHPQNWAVNGDSVELIEFPFLVNPDVNDNQANEVYFFDSPNWDDVDQEGAFTTPLGTDCIMVSNDEHNIIMKAVDCGQTGNAWYTILHKAGGQFSQMPGSYDNSEGLDNADVDVWYVAGYSIPNDWPPLNGWISTNYHDLTD